MCLRQLPIEAFGPLCDATLQSVAWVDSGADVPPPLMVTLKLCGGNVLAYTFTWVSHLRISLAQKERGFCQPFSWECSARRLEDGRVDVLFDFAGNGAITFQCQDICVPGT